MNTISTPKYKRRKLTFWSMFLILFSIAYLSICCFDLHNEGKTEINDRNAYLTEADTYTEDENTLLENSVKVNTGTYIENIQNLSLKNSSYKIDFEVWFNWENDKLITMENNFTVYNAEVNSAELLKDYTQNGQHYQRFKVNATVYQKFSTKRFPLGTYQLRFYIMPKQSINNIYLTDENKDSCVNDNMKIAGYNVKSSETGLFIYRDENVKGDPSLVNSSQVKTSEILTILEISTDSFGLYFKCIIALIGTNVWAFLTLFICTYHNVDSLSMIPAVLFGTMSNILVGANLVPDALDAGLLEFVNIWGIYTILITTVIIINVNNIRNNIKDGVFAKTFGRVMFSILLFTTCIGYIVLPLSAL